MTVSDFWNQAFLAALHRVSAEQARAEADVAVATAIAHWQTTHKDGDGPHPVWTRRADLDITRAPRESNEI